MDKVYSEQYLMKVYDYCIGGDVPKHVKCREARIFMRDNTGIEEYIEEMDNKCVSHSSISDYY